MMNMVGRSTIRNVPRALITILMLAAVLGMSTTAFAQTGERIIVLEEHLDRTWRDQLLTYRFEAAQGACHPDSITLEGPDGAMPVQLSQIETWDGTPLVRRANVSFYVSELPALSTQQFLLRYASQAASQRAESGLTVKMNGDIAEITAERIGVRLLVGERTFEPAIPIADAPSPLQGIRLLDGSWTGKGTLYGETAVTAYDAQLTTSGPVFAEVSTTYRFADGNTVEWHFRIAAGDRSIEIDHVSHAHQPETGWNLTLGGDTVRFPKAVLIAHRSYRASEIPVTLAPSANAFAELSPWAGWWWGGFPTLLRLETESAAGQIHINSRDAGAWVEAKPLAESADFRKWAPGSMGWVWGRMHASRIPLYAAEDGSVSLRSNHRQGTRRWTLSLNEEGKGQFETFIGGDQTAHTPIPRLDAVKDMVLAWPDGDAINPRLYLNAEEMQAAAEQWPDVWNGLHHVDSLAKTIGAMGRIDFMRHPMAVAGRYDALINSDRLTAEQRRLFRARTAYLQYRMADPLIWSVQRGYTSGNPNMSASFAANVGVLALALRDHPHSDVWLADSIEKFDFWLETVVDEQGYWPESSHYARVTWANFVSFGVAATRAGVRDYIGDAKFRKMAEFYEQTLTPPDPMRISADQATRVNPPYGRGVRFDAWGFAGPLAKASAERFPEFSAIMQWSWAGSAYSGQRSHEPAGLTQLYSDRALPASVPDWSSEFFGNLGYLLRQHLGTEDETYLLLSSRMARNADGEIWPADVGGILKWFAYGTPVATAFPRGPASHVMLVNRVSLAGNWDPAVGENPDNRYRTQTHAEAFAPLPALDYAHVDMTITDPLAYGHDNQMPKDVPAFPVRERAGEAPLRWHRQVMLVDDETAGGAQYMVVRDTVASPQPTQWHFWTLSEKLGSPDAVADREAVLADKPGEKIAPLSALQGDRFTAIGQFDVDLEYYIASPTNTPRHTMRYGLGGGAYGARAKNTWQDLMHLQMPGEGAYFVAIVPRQAEAAAPSFRTEAEGKVIRIEGDFGVDLAFLHHEATTATVGEATFTGTAGHIKNRGGVVSLNLLAGGKIAHGAVEVSAEHPVQLVSGEAHLTISVAANYPGGTVQFRTPGAAWRVEGAAAASLTANDGGWVLTIPAGRGSIRLTR